MAADGSIEIDVGLQTRDFKSELEDLEKELEKAQNKLNKLNARADKAFTFGLDKGRSWDSLQYDISDTELTIMDLNDKIAETKAAMVAATGTPDNIFGRIKKYFKDFGEDIEKTKEYEKETKKATAETNKFAKSVFSLGKMFQMLVLRMVMRGTINQIKEGFNNLVKYSSDANTSASMLMSSLEKLKNSLASAFAPILNVVAPILSQFIDMLSSAANMVAKFFAALTGKNKVVQATKQQKDYAKALGETEKASKSLASFDTIQKIGGNTSSTSSGSAFEEVGIDEETLSIVDQFKSKLQPLLDAFEKLKQALTPLGQTIGSGLLWLYKNVLLPVSEWALTTLFPAVIEYLGAHFNALNEVIIALQPIGEWLWENFLKPLGEWSGEQLINILTWLTEKLNELAKWISENQPLVQSLAVSIGTIVAAFILVYETVKVVNGVIAIATGLFNFLTNPITWVVAAVVALIAILYLLCTHWEEVKKWALDTWESIQKWAVETDEKLTKIVKDLFKWIGDQCSKLWTSICNVFSGAAQWFQDTIITPISDGFKAFINGLIGMVESFCNFFIDGINGIINALNSIQFDVPDWVPIIGGQKWGFSLSEVSRLSLPRLATGTVVPANSGEFAAILGDNKQETEVVSPLSTMKQAFMDALNESNHNQNITINFDGDLAQLIRVLKPYIEKEDSRVGTRLVKVG